MVTNGEKFLTNGDGYVTLTMENFPGWGYYILIAGSAAERRQKPNIPGIFFAEPVVMIAAIATGDAEGKTK